MSSLQDRLVSEIADIMRVSDQVILEKWGLLQVVSESLFREGGISVGGLKDAISIYRPHLLEYIEPEDLIMRIDIDEEEF